MDSTVLLNNIENLKPAFRSSVESIVSKNDRARYYNLMNNEGPYSLYDVVQFPTIGMLYDPYSRFFNRPVTRYGRSGIIEYYNAINEAEIESINEHFRTVNDFGGNVKEIYVSNSNSRYREGGEIALNEVKQNIDAYLAQKRYVSEDDVKWLRRSNTANLKLPHIDKVSDIEKVDRKEGVRVQTSYTEDAFYLNTKLQDNERDYTYDNNYEAFISPYDSNGVLSANGYDLSDVGNYSLLDYTNRLFASGRIGSLIDRYQTGDGQSRGRALLKKGMEPNTGTDGDTDGYKNPFCRVWTKTHQYRKMTDLIRPRVEGSGDNKRFYSLEEIQGEYGTGWRPFNGNRRLSNMSVLQPNGMVNITPKYSGNVNTLDTDSIKKCMFSIENLAWKDIIQDKEIGRKGAVGYTLTQEQRGPNGGRIMWFPPYNLSFSENVTSQWQDYSFIGRGEKIYTYTNTERTGTLSFTLLIDHPSVLDQYSATHNGAYNKQKEEFEQEVLRFFAGCSDTAVGLDITGGTGTNDNTVPSPDAEPEKEATSKPANSPMMDEDKAIKFWVFFPNNFSGMDYKWGGVNPGFSGRLSFTDILYGSKLTQGGRGYESTGSSGTELINPMKGKYGQTWYYIVDDNRVNEVLKIGGDNYKDMCSFELNASTRNVIPLCNGFDEDRIYTFQDFVACTEEWNGGSHLTDRQKKLKNILSGNNISQILVKGHASSTGNNPKENVNIARNSTLARQRAESVAWWLKEALQCPTQVDDTSIIQISKEEEADNSSFGAKKARSAEVTIYVKTLDIPDNTVENAALEQPVRKDEGDTNSRNMRTRTTVVGEKNITYDDEFRYFRHLEANDVVNYNRVIDKVKFFTPAFHSITPEGFNARLTFLHQCTRQGPSATNAVDVTDSNGNVIKSSLGNLAFGRPPYCVLRIGDFFNTKIVIDSIQINYDNNGVQWDLNPEGVGVQPMYATVNISFRFIGGTDISGPINRLQNAVSFNYYSNTSIYDRRADYRNEFIDKDDKTSNVTTDKETRGNEVNEWRGIEMRVQK